MSDLFKNAPEGADDTQRQEGESEASYLERLVGDDKKFKTPEDLARGKLEADRHIAKLEEEMEGLRGDLNSRLNMQTFLDRLEKSGYTPEDTQTPPESDSQDRDMSNTGLSMQDVEKLVSQKLEETTAEVQRRSNLEKSVEGLQAAFGPRYGDKVKAVTQEMGLGEKFMEDLAATNPQAFLKFVGANEATRPTDPSITGVPRTSFNSAATPSTSGEKTQSYYSKMRAEDPGRYWRKETQAEMHRQSMKLGEAFFK